MMFFNSIKSIIAHYIINHFIKKIHVIIIHIIFYSHYLFLDEDFNNA